MCSSDLYIVLNHIWNITRTDQKRRMLIVDEAWQLMRYDDSASFLFSLAKRARKYQLGLTTITQDVEDFVGRKMGRAIVSNSSIQLLHAQRPRRRRKRNERAERELSAARALHFPSARPARSRAGRAFSCPASADTWRAACPPKTTSHAAAPCPHPPRPRLPTSQPLL